MYQLRITVIHTLGRFSGFIPIKDPDAEYTFEGMSELAEALQYQVNNMERLVLMQNDGSEIAFGRNILKDSIFTFKVEEL